MELADQLEEHVGCRGVDVGDRLGSDQDPAWLRVGRGHPADLVPEVARVGEQEGRVEPEDDQARQVECLRIGPDVVEAAEALHTSEGRSRTATRRDGTR